MTMTLSDYKSWYVSHYGIKPSDTLIEKFININTEKVLEVVLDKNIKVKKAKVS